MKLAIKKKSSLESLESERLNIINLFKKRIDYLSEEELVQLENDIYTDTVSYAQKNGTLTVFTNKSFLKLYQSKARHYLVNLDDNAYLGNKEFRAGITDKKVALETLVGMNSRTMMPSRWTNYTKKEEAELGEIAHGKKVMPSKMFTCGKCKQKETEYYQSQDRSMDEGTTNHIKCLVCGNEWSQCN